jgi:hypothetical protein
MRVRVDKTAQHESAGHRLCIVERQVAQPPERIDEPLTFLIRR